MFADDEYIKKFTDMMSEGFIFIDNMGEIRIYNNKAKEIFGVIYNEGEGHTEGRVNPGDVVIIADNCLGKDDGDLTPGDLDIIGIRDEELKPGHILAAIGVVGSSIYEPVYKYEERGTNNKFKLNTLYLGNSISVFMDFNKKIINIKVNDEDYEMQYINSIGHMVVLDRDSMNVKFYQARGYTVRGESIHDLILGREYRAKGDKNSPLDVIGRYIFEIHDDNPTIQEFYSSASGDDISYKDKFTEINGRPTLCTLMPVNHGETRVGAVMKVEDITELKKVLRQRDEALNNLDQMEKKLNEEGNIDRYFSKILGESTDMKNVKRIAYRGAKSSSTILLLGESGTGKTLLAESIHNSSKFKDKPFIHVNCGAIPDNLLESELFGYEEGAFTGAKTTGKVGLFEAANGGTLFLDEIGEISKVVQVKLLKFLQNQTFYRVGGTKEIKVNVRIIAATNKNLEEEMLKGNFREDLYYRINVFPIWIPPLRERRSDIYPIVCEILPRICSKVGCGEKRITGEALHLLSQYNWPGNIRELENVIERAVIMSEGNTIISGNIELNQRINRVNEKRIPVKSLKEVVDEAERKAIVDALLVFNGSRDKTIKALKVGKTSFYDKLKKFNIKSCDIKNM